MATSIALLDRAPADAIEPGQLQRLQAFAASLDTLVAVEPGTNRPMVHGASLSAFLHEYFPQSFADAAVTRFQREDADHLTNRSEWHREHWAGLSRYGAPISPPTTAELDSSGLTQHPNHGQLDAWLKQHHAHLQQSTSDLTRDQVSGLVSQLSGQSMGGGAIAEGATSGDFWNCLVRHLGWWGALAVFGALGAALIILTGTGPIGLPLTIWLIGVFGGGTAVIIIDCALNPFA